MYPCVCLCTVSTEGIRRKEIPGTGVTGNGQLAHGFLECENKRKTKTVVLFVFNCSEIKSGSTFVFKINIHKY